MRKDDGFTLLEILIVVMIIGLLAAVISTQLIGRAQEAQVKMAGVQLDNLSSALEYYRLDNGRYPTTDQGLDALVREPVSEPVPRRYPEDGYAAEKLLRDPWQNPFVYESPGTHNARKFDLASPGPDGVHGTDDDLVNWDRTS